MTIILFLLLTLLLLSVWAGFYAIVKQQGRILLRLDQLEQNLRVAPHSSESAVEQAEPEGLPVGTDCSAFQFPDLAGNTVVLKDFGGKRVLLVHWNFQCGFCASIAPELARLEPAFQKQNVQLALLAYGDAPSNREHALEHELNCPILLRNDLGPAGPFDHEGTPVAYLLAEDGRVAAPVARGRDRVLALAQDVAGHEAAASPAVEPRSELGTDFPPFQFPDLGGGMVALGDLRGGRVLLVNWNFDCGFCDSIAPELAHLVAGLERKNVQLVLLARGDAQSNREQAAEIGLKCRILLVGDHPRPRPFENRGTPVAYLLDEEGRIAAPFASGADNVLALARQTAGEQSASLSDRQGSPTHSHGTPVERRERHRIKLPRFMMRGEMGLGDIIKRVTSAFGIKTCVGCERRAAVLNRWMTFSGSNGAAVVAGNRAPSFRLPDLQGSMVSLDDYRGRRVLLVFTDPHCGPCDELAPHLVRLHQEHERNGLAVILVGRGNAEENRRKAEQHGFQFPVVVQPKWRLSKEYGTYATPVAFLIGEDGVIAKDVAVGRDPIVALAQTEARALTSGASQLAPVA